MADMDVPELPLSRFASGADVPAFRGAQFDPLVVDWSRDGLDQSLTAVETARW
jgi:hypothetical protein